MKETVGALLVALTVVGASTAAHHSPSLFDQGRALTLTGVVTRVDWVNPHVVIHVEVPDARGRSAVWAVEAQSPRVMTLFGWTPTAIRRGDRVSIDAHPPRTADSKSALGRAVTRPDGTTLRIPWEPSEIREALQAEKLESDR